MSRNLFGIASPMGAYTEIAVVSGMYTLRLGMQSNYV